MIELKEINTGDSIFMLETNTVLEFEILDIFVEDDEQRLKLKGIDLTFEVSLSNINIDTFLDKEEAIATSVKYICDDVNKLIRDLSDEEMTDYVDLNSKLEKYRDLFPELFI